MSAPRTLRGIGWAHTRAMGPLHVTAQAFADLNPGIEIRWESRSLWAFGEATPDSLADEFDLIVLDHPMIGYAVERSLLVALEDIVGDGWLETQAEASVGGSHESYGYRGRHWAAAIDAACPVSVWSEDHGALGGRLPLGWDEMLNLARASGRVAVPLSPINALSLFFTLCANQGERPLDSDTGRVVSSDLGLRVLDQMAELVAAVGPSCLDLNPIAILNAMATTDEIVYCAHAYGYTNYARRGYAAKRLVFGDFQGPSEPRAAGVTLGGAGLAISSRCRDVGAAADYLQWVAGTECQRTTYVLAGGQPGNAAAWDDDLANEVCGEFFRRTRATIDHAFVRPRHPGMHEFQGAAAAAIDAFLRHERDAAASLESLNGYFRDSLVAKG